MLSDMNTYRKCRRARRYTTRQAIVQDPPPNGGPPLSCGSLGSDSEPCVAEIEVKKSIIVCVFIRDVWMQDICLKCVGKLLV